jgi:hypothetical protein
MTDHPHVRSRDRLALPQVTLCAVTSVNVKATVRALEACLDQVAFAECKLLTDAAVETHDPEIHITPIGRLGSSEAYSDFLLSKLLDHVETSHCLIVQWDGHVLDARRWQPEFLNYDYIGASWPQFQDGHNVGNGGFSLRSRKLMEACQAREFRQHHPEDVAIGRTNRDWLEAQGIRFAPRELADRFAAERAGDLKASFGYHGVFNMPRTLGAEVFWDVYRELDDRSSIRHDFASIIKAMRHGPSSLGRIARIIADGVQFALRRKCRSLFIDARRRCRESQPKG